MKTLTSVLGLLVALLGLAPLAQAQTCTPPANISATVASPSSVVVNFSPVSNAISYTVRYWWAYDTLATNVQTLTVPTPPATLTGLQYSSYRYTVTSNCTATSGATSAPQVVQLPIVGCGTPDSVRAYSTGATTATVQYRAVSGATQYYVQCLLAGTTIVVATATSTTTSASLTGLLPGTAYLVRVYATCASGISPLSGAVGFSTSGGGTASCDSVRGLSVSLITTTSARVSFTRLAGPLSYTVTYQPQGSTGGVTITTTSSPLTLSGLLPNTTYVVSIRASCTTTSMSPISSTSFATLAPAAPCGAVSNVVITATSNSTATVSFTPGANNTSFHITYYVPGDSTRWVNTTASPAILTGLIPGQTYYVQVTSICGTGTGSTYTGGSSITFNFRGALASRAALGAGVFQAYPNPAHRAASLVLPAVPGAAKAQVLLLNAVGQQVRTQLVPLSAASETRAQLDLSGVAPGLYTLRVLAGGEAASQRLVVE